MRRGKATFSRAVNSGRRWKNWKTKPIFAFLRAESPASERVREVLAVEPDPARGRAVEGAQEVEQGRLADPGDPHDGDQVPPLELEVDPLEDAELPLGQGVGLAQSFGPQDDVTHISGRRPGRFWTPAGTGRASRRS